MQTKFVHLAFLCRRLPTPRVAVGGTTPGRLPLRSSVSFHRPVGSRTRAGVLDPHTREWRVVRRELMTSWGGALHFLNYFKRLAFYYGFVIYRAQKLGLVLL